MSVFSPPIGKQPPPDSITETTSSSFQINKNNDGPILTHIPTTTEGSTTYPEHLGINKRLYIKMPMGEAGIFVTDIDTGDGSYIGTNSIYINNNLVYHQGNLNTSNFWNTFTIFGILNTPPEDPYDGATYMVGTTPTGSWEGYVGCCMTWSITFERWDVTGNNFT
jgi:hypothetical protein